MKGPFQPISIFMFEWDNTNNVGLSSIDGQHQNLFAIARELHSAMLAGQAKSVMVKILDRLVQYTDVHFTHEERLMREHGYPGFSQHKAEHDALRQSVLQFQRDFAAGKVSVSVNVLHFVRDWLDHHIKSSDAAYAPFLKSHKVA
jgi:hemerythrin-like metal-binding protein